MTTGNIDFMDVACLDGFKVLKLPYMPWTLVTCEDEKVRTYEARYSMFVFLPDTRDGITAMVDVATAARTDDREDCPRQAAQVRDLLQVG